MTLFLFIGPFLVAQAVLLDQLERASGGAVLRPRRSDYAAFGTALGWLGIPLCGVTLIVALLDADMRMVAVGVGALAVAGWWVSGRHRRRPEPHLDDLANQAHARLDTDGAGTPSTTTPRVRLERAGSVAGVRWPAKTLLRFDHDGWLTEAVPSDPIVLGGHAAKVGEAVKFDEAGRVRELVAGADLVVGRLPRGATEARGAELVTRAGTVFDPRQLRGIVLARDTLIRGVEVPAGSTVSAFHGVRVELGADTDVFGQRIEKGARLRFEATGGLTSWLRKRPEVRVSLVPKDGYRTGGERQTISLYPDGRVQ
ncbi:MAG: hypothetical protein AB8I08_12510 [Sandaracinaceae bacterium]